jgi:hypothetical protein
MAMSFDKCKTSEEMATYNKKHTVTMSMMAKWMYEDILHKFLFNSMFTSYKNDLIVCLIYLMRLWTVVNYPSFTFESSKIIHSRGETSAMIAC